MFRHYQYIFCYSQPVYHPYPRLGTAALNQKNKPKLIITNNISSEVVNQRVKIIHFNNLIKWHMLQTWYIKFLNSKISSSYSRESRSGSYLLVESDTTIIVWYDLWNICIWFESNFIDIPDINAIFVSILLIYRIPDPSSLKLFLIK